MCTAVRASSEHNVITAHKRYGLGYVCAVICIAFSLTACSLRRPPHFTGGGSTEKSARDYVDLRPGWRIQVVTPVLKSGGYMPQITETSREGRHITFTTGDDYVGYETSYYAVKERNGGGVRIVFMSAWVTENGKTTRRPRPIVPILDLPDSTRFVRLIYTIRVSQTDHDTAIVAASDPAQLDRLTEHVRTDPASACRTNPPDVCRWVPKGIAVQTEENKQK
jgi:hypothetical protein